MSVFRNTAEFRKVFDLLFALLSRDERTGAALRGLGVSVRFVINDMGLVLDVRGAGTRRVAGGDHLVWRWGGKPGWEPAVVVEMPAETANRYFQGHENVPVALAMGRLHITDGRLAAVLDLHAIVHTVFRTWVQRIQAEGWSHLLT